MTATIDDLALALDATATLVAGVAVDQWSAPTPCTGWSVRDVVNHVTAGNHLYASSLRGRPLPVTIVGAPPDLLGPDPAGSFRASADALVHAFALPGALDQQITLPMGQVPAVQALNMRVTEMLGHGWDLARASGQAPHYPDAVVEDQIAFSRALLPNLPAGRTPFAPSRPVPVDAPPLDRLAALLGRTP
ncbi:TIGR03086 family metal-binding protein [Rhodococcus maanshanensis]|uniref:TIGR03086 family protein n=1 Tax=Rhodococcus maanshanensis TaxID=183556 RepID=A0A1H7TGB3_9NOCA|nr:TIGR03086 family metal-binding protein [Rhodococcus maanshanensis]SEL83386.1 TIGR03086 family protein [Rhodococcus maanshanensis]